MTTPTPQFDVYLSYVRADREAVVELERRIQAMGLRVWRDETQLETGADWQAQLMEAMATVRMALFCVGATGLSEGQLRELAYASARVERDPDFVFTAALLPSAPADFPGDGAPDRARGTPVDRPAVRGRRRRPAAGVPPADRRERRALGGVPLTPSVESAAARLDGEVTASALWRNCSRFTRSTARDAAAASSSTARADGEPRPRRGLKRWEA